MHKRRRIFEIKNRQMCKSLVMVWFEVEIQYGRIKLIIDNTSNKS